MLKVTSLQLTLPVVFLFFTALIAFASAVYSWQRKSPGGWFFVLMLFSISVWTTGYTCELLFLPAEVKIFWAKMEYLGSVSLPVFWFLFSAHYTQRKKWLSRARIIFLFLVPLLTLLLVFTNASHGLIWTSIKPESNEIGAPLVYEHGAAFWIYTLYSYSLILTATWWLITFALKAHYLFRNQTITLVISALIPLIANILYVFHLNPIPEMDPTPIGFTFTGLLLTWGLFGFRMIDLAPIAREVLIERMTDGVVLLNNANVILDINPAACSLIGIKSADVVGKHARQVFSSFEDLVNEFRNTLDAQADICFTPDLWVDLRISPLYDKNKQLTGRLIVFRNITLRKMEEKMRKQAEQELENERRLLRTVINNIPDQIYARDRENRFILNNLSDARAMGVIDPESMIGKTDEDYYPPEQAALFKADNQMVMESNRPLIAREEPCVDFHGNDRWTLTTKVPLRDSQGEVIGLVGISRDITAQKKFEKNLEDAKHKAEIANQSKSAFLANMSHEIRTPMNAVLGFTQLLLRDPSITSSQRHNLMAINRSGEHLLGLINDILEISKIEAGRIPLNLKTFDLYKLLEDLEVMFCLPAQEKHLDINLEILSQVPRFLISDENKLRQILTNLLGNAVKFTSKGIISVRVNAFPTENSNLRLVIDVEDSGPGIAEEDLDLLFHVFQQTQLGINAGGTGLGLAISQRYAGLLGGQITVTSQLGLGSCFQLQIVVQQDETIHQEPVGPKRHIIGISGPIEAYRVLLVDGRAENRELVRELLTPLGFEVRESDNGQSALSEWENWRPHLIIMDIHLPVMDGFELAKQILAAKSSHPTALIVLTSLAFEEDKQKIIDLGVNGYLSKPFLGDDLLNLIADCLNIKYKFASTEEIDYLFKNFMDSNGLLKDGPAPIPDELLNPIRSAAEAADLDQILELVKGLDPTWPKTANQIRTIASSLHFNELMDYIKA